MFKRLAVVFGLSGSLLTQAVDDYQLGPDSMPQAGIPRGRIEQFTFTNSMVFPSTTRACWIYVPMQYEASKPAALMVFQDGQSYVTTNGQQRVSVVFDNLIHRGEMPVTIGLFVSPGTQGGGLASGGASGG